MQVLDKLKDILPGTIVSLIISSVTTLVVFSSTFSTLKAEVNYNTDALKGKVNKEEFGAVLNSLKDINQNFDRRFDKIESKIDRINERQ